MLALLALHLNVETRPIDIDRALADYAIVRFLHPAGELGYYNYIEGYCVEGGEVRKLPKGLSDPRDER